MITAERLDSWRIVPRALILSYMVVFYQTCNWFMSLPDPNNAQAGFVSVVVGAGADGLDYMLTETEQMCRFHLN